MTKCPSSEWITHAITRSTDDSILFINWRQLSNIWRLKPIHQHLSCHFIFCLQLALSYYVFLESEDRSQSALNFSTPAHSSSSHTKFNVIEKNFRHVVRKAIRQLVLMNMQTANVSHIWSSLSVKCAVRCAIVFAANTLLQLRQYYGAYWFCHIRPMIQCLLSTWNSMTAGIS